MSSHNTYGLFVDSNEQDIGRCIHTFTLSDTITSSYERQVCDDVFEQYNIKQDEGHISKIDENGVCINLIDSNRF